MLVGSLLTKEQLTAWLYTANAATATSPSELCKRPAFANLSAWLIASYSKPQLFEKLEFLKGMSSGDFNDLPRKQPCCFGSCIRRNAYLQ